MSLLTTVVDEGAEDGDGLSLVVMGPDTSLTRPLPKVGILTVGRGDTADIRLQDPLVSRVHVRFHLAGERVQVEDLQSANGTRVRDVPLAPGGSAALAPGETVTIGSTILVLQRSPGSGRARRAWPHAYFEARLEEECGREDRRPFAVFRVHLAGDCPPPRFCELVGPALRPLDVVAIYGPGEYEVLLPETASELAAAIAPDLLARLRAAGVEGRAGVACCPRDGRTPDALVSLAGERMRGGTGAHDGAGPVVEDPAMQRLYELAQRAAVGTINVLIVGETGAGKEILAEAVHRMSPRARAPFLALNCASLSENLLESELFGHERGAFTGATEAKPGLLETAPGGTVFLDELGEMPLGLQAKLLRVIETRQVTRVGGLKPRPIDVRFVAATNRKLEGEVAAGRFRQDLFFRLNGITLPIPPLRERRAEILPLARRFVAQFSRQAGRETPPVLSPEAEALLLRHPWPGNIRELRNVMERATLLCVGGEIAPEHLPDEMAAEPAEPVEPAAVVPPPGGASERDRIVAALAAHAGNQSRAARMLGMARSTLIEKIELYGIPRPRKPATRA